MNDMKPWYLSRTIWASLVSVALAVGGWFGLAPEQIDRGVLTDNLVELVTAAAGIIAIVGRLRATARIG